jgi:hypothetical protein
VSDMVPLSLEIIFRLRAEPIYQSPSELIYYNNYHSVCSETSL